MKTAMFFFKVRNCQNELSLLFVIKSKLTSKLKEKCIFTADDFKTINKRVTSRLIIWDKIFCPGK